MNMHTKDATTYKNVCLSLADIKHIRNLIRRDLFYYPLEHPQYLAGQIQNKLVEDALDNGEDVT